MPDEIPERWVPADVETTGLDPRVDLLLEIQAYIVEPFAPYEKVEPDGFHAIIQHDPETAFHQATPYVQEMHEKTGLWWKLRYGTPLAQVDAGLRAYLEEHLAPRQGFLVGNSVRLDQNFIEHHLPRSFEYLHYRAIDVTSIAMWARHEYGIGWMPKEAKHTAADDIEETLAELRWISERLTVEVQHRDVRTLPPCDCGGEDVGEHDAECPMHREAVRRWGPIRF